MCALPTGIITTLSILVSCWLWTGVYVSVLAGGVVSKLDRLTVEKSTVKSWIYLSNLYFCVSLPHTPTFMPLAVDVFFIWQNIV